MLILNDIHLGVNRQGGTTPASREALRSYLFGSFEDQMHTEDDVCILGDLFDQFEVEGRDWLQCFLILQDYLVRCPKKLTLVAGNHDHSPKALRVSSFEMLCKVLVEQFGPERVQVVSIDQGAEIEPGIHAIAHCSNQDQFNFAISVVLAKVKTGDRVLLHCNYDNNFAAQSDHSLNLSRDQAEPFMDRGVSLYFAHEHQAREAWAGRVVVFGNQWPTSISDCLHNDKKYAHIFNGGVTKVMTWCGADEPAGFCEVDWRDLGDAYTDCGGFFRVEGKASANEAGECISAIAKFRAKSQAYVITNAVKIEGIAENSDLPESFEATKAFDVNEFVDQNLDAAQLVAVNKLRGVMS